MVIRLGQSSEYGKQPVEMSLLNVRILFFTDPVFGLIYLCTLVWKVGGWAGWDVLHTSPVCSNFRIYALCHTLCVSTRWTVQSVIHVYVSMYVCSYTMSRISHVCICAYACALNMNIYLHLAVGLLSSTAVGTRECRRI